MLVVIPIALTAPVTDSSFLTSLSRETCVPSFRYIFHVRRPYPRQPSESWFKKKVVSSPPVLYGPPCLPVQSTLKIFGFLPFALEKEGLRGKIRDFSV